MTQSHTVLFICEHGAAKSIIAATYFNQLADRAQVNFYAIARGTNPDQVLSPNTIAGLQQDGLMPAESTPQKPTDLEIESADRIITFCDLPPEYQNKVRVEHWAGVPAVSEDYAKARDAIVERVKQLLNE